MPHDQKSTHSSTTAFWRSAGLFAVRYGIGAALILAGVVVLLAVEGDLGAYGFASGAGAGLAVLLLNLLYRMSVSGDRDREHEEAARRYFDEHGVWPDDEEAPERVSGRRWTLPRGAVTAEQEERDGKFPGRRRVDTTISQTR
jgi:hypothetical protein